jgi:hypothetical protein
MPAVELMSASAMQLVVDNIAAVVLSDIQVVVLADTQAASEHPIETRLVAMAEQPFGSVRNSLHLKQ